MPGDERSRTADLTDGDLEVLGRFERSSNGTFLAVARGSADGDGDGVPVVYKPSAAEQPLWDFPAGELCRREVAAAALAGALGWPRVPTVILRDGPFGPGSVQRFVEHDANEHALSLLDRFPGDLRAVAAFDVVANNADRKAGHCLLGTDGLLYAIDHGLTFHEEPKLRTVLWDFAGEPVPEPLLDDLRRAAGPELREALAPLLSPREVEATRLRIEALLADPVFPEPTGDRPVPWPPL